MGIAALHRQLPPDLGHSRQFVAVAIAAFDRPQRHRAGQRQRLVGTEIHLAVADDAYQIARPRHGALGLYVAASGASDVDRRLLALQGVIGGGGFAHG